MPVVRQGSTASGHWRTPQRRLRPLPIFTSTTRTRHHHHRQGDTASDASLRDLHSALAHRRVRHIAIDSPR
jgi:hypothetical protein